jgi:hypothetical protein
MRGGLVAGKPKGKAKGKKKTVTVRVFKTSGATVTTVPFTSLNDSRCQLRPLQRVELTVTQGTPDCQITKRVFVGTMVELPKGMQAAATTKSGK